MVNATALRFQSGFSAPQGGLNPRKLVMIESPFADKNPDTMRRNVDYAKKSMIDSVMFHQEAPMLSHLLYTQVLDEDDAVHRDQGINAGLAWRSAANKTIVYKDLGISNGMRYGIEAAQNSGNPVEFRSLKTCGHETQVDVIFQNINRRSRGLKTDIIA